MTTENLTVNDGNQRQAVKNIYKRLPQLYAVPPFTWNGRKEGNILFNDTLNTIYLRSHGIRHMVKDHSDSEKGNLLLG